MAGKVRWNVLCLFVLEFCFKGVLVFRRVPVAYSPDQTDSQVNASQHKLAKPELACASSHIPKQKVAHFPHIQLTCDQLVSTFVGWTNGETLASTWVRTNFSSTRVNASPVHASRWPNETYVQRKFKTRVDLPTAWPKHHGLSARVSVQLSRCHKPTSSPLG